MAIHKTEAIVLRATKFRDTSLITTFFTADFGKLKALSKGVRKEKSPVLAHYEPFAHTQIVFYEKMRSDIHFLSENTLINFFPKIRADFDKIIWASYLAELLDVVMPVHERNRGLFKLVLQTLRLMETGIPPGLINIFEIKLLSEIGLFPNLEKCLKCGKSDIDGYLSLGEGGMFCEGCRPRTGTFFALSKGLIKTMRFFLLNDFSRNLQLRISKEMENGLHRMMFYWVYYRFDRELTTVRFLRDVAKLSPHNSAQQEPVP